MISTSVGRLDQREGTIPGLPPAGTVEHSLVEPQTVRSWARRFTDSHDVTWWVHLVRAGARHEVDRRGRLPAMTLRFQNGISTHARYLHPIPPDWRECDDMTLWVYCEQAIW